MKNTSSDKKRVPYGFKLTFPAIFTIRELRKQKFHKVSYITLRKRVEIALKNNVVVPVGSETPAGRGRPQLVYARVEA